MVSRYLSPLRYPGGKDKISATLLSHFEASGAEVWFEPFAGGAGVGLRALLTGAAEELWLAEADPAVYALWQTILSDPGELMGRIACFEPSVADFHNAKKQLDTAEGIDLGFACLIVNRCSYSGMLTSGVIGGDQSGRYHVGSRFNARSLIERIEQIAEQRHRIRLIGSDGLAALEELPVTGMDQEVFVFADPPYIGAGHRLYRPEFGDSEHRRLSIALDQLSQPWALTIDKAASADELYWEVFAGRSHIDVSYSLAGRSTAPEWLVTRNCHES